MRFGKKQRTQTMGSYVLDENGRADIMDAVDAGLRDLKYSEKDRDRLARSLQTMLARMCRFGLEGARVTLRQERGFASQALVLEVHDVPVLSDRKREALASLAGARGRDSAGEQQFLNELETIAALERTQGGQAAQTPVPAHAPASQDAPGLSGSQSVPAPAASVASAQAAPESPEPSEPPDPADPEAEPPFRTLEIEGLEWTFSRTGSTLTARLVRPRKLLGSASSFLVAIVAAVLTVLLFGIASPAALDTFVERIASPLFDAGIGLIVSLMGVMVFLAITTSIAGISGVDTLKRIGSRVISRLMATNIVGLAAAIAGSLVILRGSIVIGSDALDTGVDLFDFLIGIIPTSLFQPFIDGNILQISVWAVVFGVGLIVLKGQHPGIVQAAFDLNAIVQWAIGQLTRLMPLIVYLACVRLSVSLSADSLLALLQFFVVMAVCLAACALLFVAGAARRRSMGFGMLLKAVLPTATTAFLTASSSACYSSMCEVLKVCGVKDSVAKFHLPMALVLSHGGAIVLYALAMATDIALEGAAINAPQLCTMFLLAFVTAIATPSVPGGSVAMYALLFTAMGLPDTYLPLFVAVDTLADMMLTSVNVVADITSGLHVDEDLKSL